MSDLVPECLSIPPKYSVVNTVGILKGNSAIRIHREYMGKQRNFPRFYFCPQGYRVSTAGLDESTIRQYIRNQNPRKSVRSNSLWKDISPLHDIRAPSEDLHHTARSAEGI